MASSINENGNKYKPFLGAKLSSEMLFETLPERYRQIKILLYKKIFSERPKKV